jgi:NTP pyrophosphatase (non-canonical NTP hydrolase)
MEIKEAQKQSWRIIEDWCKKNNKEHEPKTVFPHLVEEVGEVARELNHHIDNWKEEPNKDNLAKEMADVLDKLFILATDNEIDLEEAFVQKNKLLRERFELD